MARTAAAVLCVAITCTGCAASTSGGLTKTSTEPDQPSPVPVALWIGDSYTAGAGGISLATSESEDTSGFLHWHAAVDAEGGTGFVAAGHAASPSNEPVPARLANDMVDDPNPSAVVIDAGRNDRGIPAGRVRRAVVSYFKALEKAYPTAAIVVIAPYLMTSKPGDYLALRRLLRRQAQRHGWAFVDPIAEGWINKTSAKLVASDGVHPNQQGQYYIADHLAPAIESALAAAHEEVK